MKRFALFVGWDHIAGKGWLDLSGRFTSKSDAEKALREGRFTYGKPDWWHIVDLETDMIVAASDATLVI
ncbi:hypothetical protein [Methylobacterium sp. yr668]|uniref:hypothetical protein n=1 Tax=Methylobacterium sp. yr668 TaxID=1761801 RepID=UPI0008DF5C66|nr:hypothetical protein [Methylobacterium sp. yr668]SFS87053.1 hypothetical protein SAMN04487845_108263 [Methylobacterium sp. yr668]